MPANTETIARCFRRLVWRSLMIKSRMYSERDIPSASATPVAWRRMSVSGTHAGEPMWLDSGSLGVAGLSWPASRDEEKRPGRRGPVKAACVVARGKGEGMAGFMQRLSARLCTKRDRPAMRHWSGLAVRKRGPAEPVRPSHKPKAVLSATRAPVRLCCRSAGWRFLFSWP